MKKRNLASKIMTTGMAAALAIGMSVAPVMAATPASDKVMQASGATITKNLYVATDVSRPGTKFQFTVAPATDAMVTYANNNRPKDSDGKTNYDVKAGTLSSKTVDAQFTAKQTDASVSTSVLFTDSDFTSVTPGVYAFQVTENDPTQPANGTITKDSTVYYVEVKVDYNSQKTSTTAQDGTVTYTGGNEIAGVTAQKITYGEDKTTISSFSAKQDTIDFNNKYTVYGNEDPDDDPDKGDDGDTTKGLVVKKHVTGTAGTAGTFKFTVTFTEDSTAFAGSSTEKVNDGLKIKASAKVTGDSSNSTGNTGEIAANTEFDYGTYTFELTNDGEIDFEVPAGTSYKVEEDSTSSAGYTVTHTGDNDSTISATTSKVVEFTNNKDTNPLTGIVNNYGGLIAVVAIAAGGMVVISVRRRREDV